MPGLNSSTSRFLISRNISENLLKRLTVSFSIVAAETIWFTDCTYIGGGKEGCILFLVIFIARTGIYCCRVKYACSENCIEIVLVPMFIIAFISLRAGHPRITF